MAQAYRRGCKAEYTDRPLTEEERIFAEVHHDMIYRYLRIHRLSIDPWYDILVIPYLQAIKKYHTYEYLQNLKFDQIFFRTLDNARSNYYRALNRQKRCAEGEWPERQRRQTDLAGQERFFHIKRRRDPGNRRRLRKRTERAGGSDHRPSKLGKRRSAAG